MYLHASVCIYIYIHIFTYICICKCLCIYVCIHVQTTGNVILIIWPVLYNQVPNIFLCCSLDLKCDGLF